MRTVRSVPELRAALAPARTAGRRIGLVPTMGAFHEGHLSLMRRAREECEVVVVWLFVNPAQFNDPADLAEYPRDERRDAELAAAVGVDYLFIPAAQDVYPPGFQTTVSVAGLTETLEGAHRGRGHFDGVTTVVTKFLNMVAPDVAYLGQKDAQQVAVIRRLIRDLDLPVRIVVCPTVRADDGLALSSRNVLLSPSERRRGLSLHRALQRVRESMLSGERDPQIAKTAGLAELTSAGIEPDYLELVAPDTLQPVSALDGEVLALIAARVGDVRLIDNDLIAAKGPSSIAVDERAGIQDVNYEVATPDGAPTT